MKRWITFNIEHPQLVCVLLLIVTLVTGFGLRNLYIDSSTDALMPKDDIAYKMNVKANQIFFDTETFILVSIEAEKDENLFSGKIFQHIYQLIIELEEYKNFDRIKEDKRLHTLISLGNVKAVSRDRNGKRYSGDAGSVKSDIESELDEEIFNEQGADLSGEQKVTSPQEDGAFFGDLLKPQELTFKKAVRKRNEYDYNNYKNIPLKKIINALDEEARLQLQTVLRYNKIYIPDYDHLLTKEEFVSILETWETLYLYKSKEIIKELLNPVTSRDITGKDNELRTTDLIPVDESGKRLIPETETEFSLYKKRIVKNAIFKNSIYSLNSNGDINALGISIVLQTQGDYTEISNYLYEIIQKYNRTPVKLTPVGIPVFMKFLKDYMKQDLVRFLPVVVLVIIITFIINFRRTSGVLLSTVSILLSTVWTTGIMGHFHIPITMVVNMLPPLLIAVASSDAIHMFNQYLQDQEKIHKAGKKQGLMHAMNHISTTVLLTSVTTFIGFATLLLNQVVSLKHFGIFAALGTVIAMTVNVFLIPSCLMLMKLLPLHKDKKLNKAKRSYAFVRSIINLFMRLALNHNRKCILVTVVLVVTCSIGIFTIKTETGPMYSFKKNSYVYRSDLKVSRLFQGTMVINLVFDSGRSHGAHQPEFLQMLEEIQQHITNKKWQKEYNFMQTSSYGDVIKRMHMAMNNDNKAFYRIPENEATILDYHQIYSDEDRDSDGRIDTFEQFVDPQYRLVNILIRVGSFENRLYSTEILERADDALKKYLNDHPVAGKYKWFLMGEPKNYLILGSYILKGQILSIVITLIIIGIVVFLLFLNWKASVISLIPISISIILVYGSMGFLGIPLDIPKALLAAIAIGIGIDDTIHMLKTLRYQLEKGVPIRTALIETYLEAGIAIVYTSVALILGFSVFLLSNFLPVFYLGLLVVSTMIITTFAALVVLPSVIILFNISMRQNVKSGFFEKISLMKIFKLNE